MMPQIMFFTCPDDKVFFQAQDMHQVITGNPALTLVPSVKTMTICKHEDQSRKFS